MAVSVQCFVTLVHFPVATQWWNESPTYICWWSVFREEDCMSSGFPALCLDRVQVRVWQWHGASNPHLLLGSSSFRSLRDAPRSLDLLVLPFAGSVWTPKAWEFHECRWCPDWPFRFSSGLGLPSSLLTPWTPASYCTSVSPWLHSLWPRGKKQFSSFHFYFVATWNWENP